MSSDRTEDFDFHLPESLIAQEPARPREAARLLDATQPDMFADRHIRDLPSLLKRGDLLVANNTAVIRAQLHGLRGEAKIGITLDQIQPDGSWHVLVRNARRLKVGDTIAFPGVQDTARVQALEPGSRCGHGPFVTLKNGGVITGILRRWTFGAMNIGR